LGFKYFLPIYLGERGRCVKKILCYAQAGVASTIEYASVDARSSASEPVGQWNGAYLCIQCAPRCDAYMCISRLFLLSPLQPAPVVIHGYSVTVR
jgi:hypothetical protein